MNDNVQRDYAYWHAALAGQKPKAFTDDPQCGFYRRRNKDKETKKITYDPVAIWRDPDIGLIGLVGNRDVTGDQLKELWNWIADKPVTEEAYRAAQRGEPWHDEHRAKQAVEIKQPGYEIVEGKPFIDPERGAAPAPDPLAQSSDDPAKAIIADIEAAEKGVTQYATVDSDEQSAKGQDLRSQLTTLAGKLDKYRESLVRPHIDAQRDINAKFNPIITRAKGAANKVRDAMEAWERHKREQARRAELERERIEQANAAAAKAAEDAGKPAPAPQPPPPPINTPAPAEQIKGASRAAAVREVFRAVIVDQDALYQAVKTNPIIIEALRKIAQARVDAGIDTPGVEKKEDVKIR